MFTVANIEFLRRRFEKPNSYYGPAGKAPQLSLIRIEEDLINGRGQYQFDLKKKIAPNSCEVGLKRNDLFITCAMGIATRIEDEDHPNIYVPNFSPQMADTTTSGSAVTVNVPGFQTNDIMALYNGKIYIGTGNIVNFEDLPTSLFLHQQSDDTTIIPTGKAIRNKTFNFENELRTMAEEIVLAGTQDHKIEVTFPTYAGADYSAAQAKDANGDVISKFKTKIVLLILGYRIVDGTSNKAQDDPNNPYAPFI